MIRPVEMSPAARATWNALVEEHLAVQGLLQGLMERDEPTEAESERLIAAFAKAAELLKANTVDAPDEPARRGL